MEIRRQVAREILKHMIDKGLESRLYKEFVQIEKQMSQKINK